MEALVLDGKSYVKASKAARDLGYATDYVGQLCRSGQVDAHLIGRTWYVDQDQLAAHRVEKKRMSRVKAREQAKALIASNRAKTAQSTKSSSSRITAKNVPISYERDEAPLIPETRKLDVSSDYLAPEPVFEEVPELEAEDTEQEIVTSEDVESGDESESLPEEEEVVLKPEIVEEELERLSVKNDRPRGVSDIYRAAPISFIERLEEASVIKEEKKEPVSAPSASKSRGSKYSLFMHCLFFLVVVGIVLASFPLRMTMTYDIDRNPSFNSHLSFSLEETIAAFQKEFKSR